MLKAVYYLKGYKIMAVVDEERHKASAPFYVFKLVPQAYQKMHDRRGTGFVSGIQCGKFKTYDNALEYILKAPKNIRHHVTGDKIPETDVNKWRRGKK